MDDNEIVMPNVEIIVGTYEEFLLGYKIEYKSKTLKQSFADKSHSGAVKCLAVQGYWIASGGTDDRVFIYDMRTRKQTEIILTHSGTVNTLAFTPEETHLLSGDEDGRLVATSTTKWNRDGLWEKAHNGLPVKHVCCHNSGKLALSLGGDLVLRTWNLVKGRLAYKTNLKSRTSLANMPECLVWSPNCEFFSLCGPRIVEIWSLKTANVIRSHELKTKPTCLVWINDNVCLVGLEDGNIFWFPLEESNNKVRILNAHKSRVKAMCLKDNTLMTASSAGELKVWEIKLDNEELREIARTNIGCRPICMGLLDLNQFGEDYVLNRSTTKEEKQKQPISNRSSMKKQIPQSVVTIEYETNVESHSPHKFTSSIGSGDDSEDSEINNVNDNNLDESNQDANEVTSDEDRQTDSVNNEDSEMEETKQQIIMSSKINNINNKYSRKTIHQSNSKRNKDGRHQNEKAQVPSKKLKLKDIDTNPSSIKKKAKQKVNKT